jgi:small subunit ribosomal protein S20
MAHSKSALKRWRQSLKARDRNRARRSFARSSVRKLREAVAAANPAEASTALGAAYSALDRAARHGAIHKGKADRTKRRLAALARRSGSED